MSFCCERDCAAVWRGRAAPSVLAASSPPDHPSAWCHELKLVADSGSGCQPHMHVCMRLNEILKACPTTLRSWADLNMLELRVSGARREDVISQVTRPKSGRDTSYSSRAASTPNPCCRFVPCISVIKHILKWSESSRCVSSNPTRSCAFACQMVFLITAMCRTIATCEGTFCQNAYSLRKITVGREMP
jgi:hypothetical protein